MNQTRKELRYHYTLTPEWLEEISQNLGATLTDRKFLRMPKEIADGSAVFLEVLPGLSVFLLDMHFHQPVAITRVPKGGLYMAYYDLGEEITTHLLDGNAHKAGYSSKLGMAFMDSGVTGSILPPVGARSYSLRLLISKKLLHHLAAQNHAADINEALFDEARNTLYFYSHIDSRSRILLNRLKGRDIDDASFEFHLKSVALHLLAYLVERAARFDPIINKLSEQEMDAIKASADYLLANLLSDFPSIEMLANRAAMSVSKYKLLFKKILKNSPKQFFIEEKLLLGKKLLESGNFKNVTQVAFELGYSKPSYFAEVFRKRFGINPGSLSCK